MTTWLETLPQSPLLENYAETLPNTVIRTEMEQGPAKVRQRSTAAASSLSLVYFLNATQLGDFENFYAVTLKGGSLAFDFPHPRSGATVSCRFLKEPEIKAVNGNYFKIIVELEVLP